ncbi:MAG: dTDP-4-amino-4,6-dideoxygalactose transaminase [Chitinophagales bacterium]|nr:dTDP-4-amino-4,6-dideoxygalactose transaminase [Chitinophagales bacterium]
MIRFNQPFITGKEIEYIQDCIEQGRLSGNGKYTKLCHTIFQKMLGSKKVLLTTSCTDALEMTSLLADIKFGDEVIIPSYTFVSSANAYVLRDATIRFADSEEDFPNIDADKIEELITPKTKAIVVVHYAGAACDMDKIMSIAKKHNLVVIEDAAQCIDSYYKGKPLGSIGDMSAFSFHETKNIISGEGGLLAVNNPDFVSHAEIIWEKGTNRAAFYRGETDKYTWVDRGSSFLPSDITAAFLYAQLLQLEEIQKKRVSIWDFYYENLKELESKGKVKLPKLKEYQSNNGHVFFLQTDSIDQRDDLIQHLKKNEIMAVFHYLTLHDSPFYAKKHDGRSLPNARKFGDTLLRLPLHANLSEQDLNHIATAINSFYE